MKHETYENVGFLDVNGIAISAIDEMTTRIKQEITSFGLRNFLQFSFQARVEVMNRQHGTDFRSSLPFSPAAFTISPLIPYASGVCVASFEF